MKERSFEIDGIEYYVNENRFYTARDIAEFANIDPEYIKAIRHYFEDGRQRLRFINDKDRFSIQDGDKFKIEYKEIK